jgi:hypothetical protein
MSEPTQSVLKTAETSLNFGKGKITEADVPVRHIDISVPKDDRSLFPEIAPHTPSTKTFDQTKIVIDEIAIGQSSGSGIPEEPILSEQVPPPEVLYLFMIQIYSHYTYTQRIRYNYVYIFLLTGNWCIC